MSEVAELVSLEIGSMFGGGGGMCTPRSRSATNTPRFTGDVLVPLAVTFITAGCVQSPPKGEPSGSLISRSTLPNTSGRP